MGGTNQALLPDHIHLTLGCQLNEAPQDVALVGTFGEYDLGVVPRDAP